MTPRHKAERRPLVRPGVRRFAYGLVAANVLLYASFWMVARVKRRQDEQARQRSSSH